MSGGNYRKALDEAVREYERLTRQRAEIDGRIAQLVQTMGGLARLCNMEPAIGIGITDACRMALKAAGRPLTPIEVRTRLEIMGLDLSRYRNPLASIHTVLKRLLRAGEITFLTRSHDKAAYAWKRLESPGSEGALCKRLNVIVAPGCKSHL